MNYLNKTRSDKLSLKIKDLKIVCGSDIDIYDYRMFNNFTSIKYFIRGVVSLFIYGQVYLYYSSLKENEKYEKKV